MQGHVPVRSDRHQAHRGHGRRDLDVGLRLPARRRRVARVVEIHRGAVRPPAGRSHAQDHLRERGQILRADVRWSCEPQAVAGLGPRRPRRAYESERARRSPMMRLCTLLVAAALVAGAACADAAELHILSAGAVRSIVTDLATAFEKETGHTVKLAFGTVGVIKSKLASADPADVAIMTDTALDEMTRQGVVREGTWAMVGRTGIGVGVRDGAPKPDIGSPEAFKQALLSAKSLTYVDPAAGATSGIHFAGVLKQLGIADAVKSKTTLVPGGYPAELVAKGEVAMVVHQISEIVPVKGVTLVGPLPKELQKVTVYSAGVAVATASKGAAREFVAFLARPDFKPQLAAAGLDYKE